MREFPLSSSQACLVRYATSGRPYGGRRGIAIFLAQIDAPWLNYCVVFNQDSQAPPLAVTEVPDQVIL